MLTTLLQEFCNIHVINFYNVPSQFSFLKLKMTTPLSFERYNSRTSIHYHWLMKEYFVLITKGLLIIEEL